MQWPQRFAAMRTLIAHCGQSFVVGAAAGAGFVVQRFTCYTTRNTQNAMIRKFTMEFRNNP